ncbi:MAG: helix-turn-helix domain-containing protein [Erysipelotrichaceae bacterium]
MYKAIIIDTDKSIRNALNKNIDWHEQDIEIVNYMKDTDMLINVLNEYHPNIVLMDYEVTDCNQPSLIKQIHSIDETIQVIIISDHYEYNNVRWAMKDGAFDYLLKSTLNEEDLITVLNEVKECFKVSDEESSKQQEHSLEKLKQLLVLRKNKHAVYNHEFINSLQEADLKVLEGDYQIAYFRVDNIHLIYSTLVHNHAQLKENLSNMIETSIPSLVHHQVIFVSNHSGIIIFKGKDKLRTANICNIIMKNINQNFKLDLSITISRIAHHIETFLSLYDNLLELHEMRFYVGERVLIETEELPTFNLLNFDEITFHLDIITCMEQRRFDEIKEIKTRSLAYMKEHFIKPENVKEFYYFVFNNIEGKEMEKGLKTTLSLENEKTKINLCETIDKLNEILDELFMAIEQWVRDNSMNRYRKDVMDIIHYLDANYRDKITLTMLSERFKMNESYLSRMFKKQTGENLIYYINEKKMQQALVLLQDPNIKIKEVALSVGIEDQFYFNKVFKKFYQVSPSEFRKKK